MRQHVGFAVLATALTIGVSGTSMQGRTDPGAATVAEAQDSSFANFRNGRGRSERFSAKLEGENEVPVVSTPARGKFEAELDDDALAYELSFEGLQAAVTQAHIHIAQPDVNGVIVLWLCGTGTGGTAGPAGTLVCPQTGTIAGVLSAANVVGPNPLPPTGPTQGIAAGEFAKVIEQIKKGNAYVNVHTAQSGGGEIRGQLREAHGRR
jgi:hypothetical protein